MKRNREEEDLQNEICLLRKELERYNKQKMEEIEQKEKQLMDKKRKNQKNIYPSNKKFFFFGSMSNYLLFHHKSMYPISSQDH